MKHHIEEILKEFGDYVGIADLGFDEDNLCTLAFDELIACFSYREKTNQLIVYADVGLLPAEPPPPVMRMLLEANCLQPQGTTLGIRKDEERHAYVVALSCLVDANGLSQERFQKILEGFINVQEGWQERLQHPEEAAAQSAQPGETPQAMQDDKLFQPHSSIRA